MTDEKSYYNLENKTSKLEDAIAKLTDISADLNKMIAVHELRISQQEKTTDSLEIIFEKRREEVDTKFGKLYENLREEDKTILEELDKLTKKVSDIEKFMWTSVGGLTIMMLLVTEGPQILKMIKGG